MQEMFLIIILKAFSEVLEYI